SCRSRTVHRTSWVRRYEFVGGIPHQPSEARPPSSAGSHLAPTPTSPGPHRAVPPPPRSPRPGQPHTSPGRRGLVRCCRSRTAHRPRARPAGAAPAPGPPAGPCAPPPGGVGARTVLPISYGAPYALGPALRVRGMGVGRVAVRGRAQVGVGGGRVSGAHVEDPG